MIVVRAAPRSGGGENKGTGEEKQCDMSFGQSKKEPGRGGAIALESERCKNSGREIVLKIARKKNKKFVDLFCSLRKGGGMREAKGPTEEKSMPGSCP